VPDPQNVESHEQLLARARELHPDKTIPDDAPSRFHKDGGAAAAPVGAAAGNGTAAAPAAGDGATAQPAPAPKAPAASAAVAPKAPPAATAAAAAPPTAVKAAPLSMINLPKDIGALPGPLSDKHFASELEQNFEAVLAMVDYSAPAGAPRAVQVALRLAEPVLGAMPDGVKQNLEDAVGTPAGFSKMRSTALNVTLNLILYPALFLVFAVAVLGDPLFSQTTRGWIALGVLIATIEAAWRLREGILHSRPASEVVYRGCWYGVALAPLGQMLARSPKRRAVDRKVAFDGFRVDLHDEKLERDRRYGTVYTVAEYSNAYLVRLEMPRKLPQSSLKRLWNLPDEMPDYDYSITLENDVLVINASVRGESLRRLSYVSSSFPADFQTRIEFARPVSVFKHRMRDKVLEVIVLTGQAGELRAAA
jgi:hypothetical protein